MSEPLQCSTKFSASHRSRCEASKSSCSSWDRQIMAWPQSPSTVLGKKLSVMRRVCRPRNQLQVTSPATPRPPRAGANEARGDLTLGQSRPRIPSIGVLRSARRQASRSSPCSSRRSSAAHRRPSRSAAGHRSLGPRLRPRTARMTARAGLNVVIAAYCLWLVRRQRAVGAKIGAAAMVAATAADSRTIVALRRAR